MNGNQVMQITGTIQQVSKTKSQNAANKGTNSNANNNAASLFSLSNNINYALESYKDVQETETESKG